MSEFQLRVYYEDTDFSGHVYHANYLKYCERARSAYLREQGVDQNAMFAAGQAFVVRKMDCDFLRPAKFDDELLVETALKAMSGARFELTQVIRCRGAIIFSAQVAVAMIGKNGRPLRVPNQLKAIFKPAQ